MSLPVVVIIQHDPNDKPCFFGTYLETHVIPYIVFHCYDPVHAAALPSSVLDTVLGLPNESPDGLIRTYTAVVANKGDEEEGSTRDGDAVDLRIAGVASFGGHMSANDNFPYYTTVFQLFRSAMELRIPVIGHCLGAQLLSVALGGRVAASPGVELGWVTLNTDVPHATTTIVSDEGLEEEVPVSQEDIFDWFGAGDAATVVASPAPVVFEWHGESFSIPHCCVRLASTPTCPNQAFQVVGKPVFGMQFHVEVERSKMDAWVAEGHPGLFATKAEKAVAEAKRATRQQQQSWAAAMTIEEFEDERLFESRLESSKTLADHIYQTWTSFLPLQ